MELINENNVDDYKNTLSVIYVSSPTCAPCKVMSPIIENLSTKYTNIKFGKVNTQENRDVALDLGVRSVPTTIIFKNGNEVERFIGIQKQNNLENIFNSL